MTPTINGDTNHPVPKPQLNNVDFLNFYTLWDRSGVQQQTLTYLKTSKYGCIMQDLHLQFPLCSGDALSHLHLNTSSLFILGSSFSSQNSYYNSSTIIQPVITIIITYHQHSYSSIIIHINHLYSS